MHKALVADLGKEHSTDMHKVLVADLGKEHSTDMHKALVADLGKEHSTDMHKVLVSQGFVLQVGECSLLAIFIATVRKGENKTTVCDCQIRENLHDSTEKLPVKVQLCWEKVVLC